MYRYMYAGQANIAKMTPLQQQFDVVRTVRIRMWYTYVRPTAGNSAAICFGKRVINATFQLSLWI